MPHTYARPWLLVAVTSSEKWTLISRYASRESADDAVAMYGRGYRSIHVDELDEEKRISMRISKGSWPSSST